MMVNDPTSLKFLAPIVCWLIVSFASPLINAADDLDHQAVTIWSQGVRLAGDVYKPKGLESEQKLPGILLVPGWGGSKKNIGKNYALDFASKGFVVLAFDFKGWGESDGLLLASERLPTTSESTEVSVSATHIRQIVDPVSMMADVRAALNYLSGEPQVQPDNIGVFGTSMGGGLALVIAASDNRIQALVDQMGSVNYQYNLRAMPAAAVRQTEVQVARGELPPFPGPESQINPALKGFPNWVSMKEFNPVSFLDQLTVPTLLIDAQAESLFETEKNGKLVYETIKDRVTSRYITYPGQHYDMYRGENLKAARTEATEWFETHLKSN